MVDYQDVRFVMVSLGEADYSGEIIEKLDESHECGDGTIMWHLTNKYFDAEVTLFSCTFQDFIEHTTDLSKLEAILLMFHHSKNSVLEEVKKAEEYFKASDYPDLRMLWNVSNASLKEEERDDLFSWCLDHQFEFIENEDIVQDDEEEDGGFQEKYGIDRILEALKSHMWSNHTMKDEKHKASGNLSRNGEGTSNMEFDEQSMQGGESFEDLVGRLQAMKEKARSLEGDARRDYAEKVAFAFMEALGIDESDDDDGDR